MTVIPTMVHGVTYAHTITAVQDLRHLCPTVANTVSAITTATHIVIKQEYDALDLLEMHAPKMEAYDFLMDRMKMKGL